MKMSHDRFNLIVLRTLHDSFGDLIKKVILTTGLTVFTATMHLFFISLDQNPVSSIVFMVHPFYKE